MSSKLNHPQNMDRAVGRGGLFCLTDQAQVTEDTGILMTTDTPHRQKVVHTRPAR